MNNTSPVAPYSPAPRSVPKPRGTIASRAIHQSSVAATTTTNTKNKGRGKGKVGRVHATAKAAKKSSHSSSASASSSGATRKAYRFRPGTVALREIRRFQGTTGFLIQRAPFRRLVREYLSGGALQDYNLSAPAADAFQEAAESYLVSLLGDANLCTLHGRRVTLMARDVQLAARLRGDRH